MCRDNRVALDDRILRTGRRQIPHEHMSEWPNQMYAAVARAGAILREHPQAELANQPITRSMQRGFPHDLASRALTTIINASLDPVPAASWDTSFTSFGVAPVDNCSLAERFFAATVWQLQQPGIPLIDERPPIGSQLLTGDNDTIIAIRKGLGSRSCLTLVPVTINSVPYPAGSIMRVNLLSEYNGKRYISHRGTRVTDIPVERISHINFLRLSAFALPPSLRPTEFPRMYRRTAKHKDQKEEILAKWSLKRIRQLATTVLANNHFMS